MKPLARYFTRFLDHRWKLLGGFVAVPLARGADILVTLGIGAALNELIADPESNHWRGGLFWIGLYALAQGLASFLQRWLVISTSRHVERDLKQQLFDQLTRLSFSFHNRSRSGDIVSRLTSDVENVRMFLGPGLMFATASLVMLPITLVLLLRINASLALTMAIPLTIMGAGFRFLTPKLHAASKDVQEGLADLSHRAQENFAGVRVVKGFARETHQAQRFEEASALNRDRQIHLARVRGLAHTLAGTSSQLTFVVILLLGGRALIDGRMGFGDTLVFIDLTLKIFWPIITIGWLAGMYPRAVASAQRISDVMDAEVEIQGGETRLADVRGEYRLQDVSFTYPEAQRAALSNIDLHLPAGSRLGVVGPTGCGKSTLLLLFGRLYEAEGEFTLDSVPLRDIDLSDMRQPIGYVPQDSFLFSETWAENVGFGAEEPLEERELEALADAVCMTEELEQFPKGRQELIGERGVTLSGGQRQRTCIARALARKPRILILDDALSAVDTETEARLIEHLRETAKDCTVLVAAHRLSSVRDADQILVLATDGSPEDLGTHDELLERGGWYARAWEQQQSRRELDEL